MAKILEWLLALIKSLKPPLDFEVLRFSAEEARSDRSHLVVVITGRPPRYYYVQLRLTNQSETVVYIKSFVLIIPDKKLRRAAEWHKTVRLEAHEIMEHVAIFGIKDGEVPVKGNQAQIEVTPSVGRKTIKPAST
jgi:hypothetical protein